MANYIRIAGRRATNCAANFILSIFTTINYSEKKKKKKKTIFLHVTFTNNYDHHVTVYG
ncbi:hypothetical protein HanRHA438_Chr15g0689861 [Helianthus annuus]|nr:hypothetical protein HanRHA438_Chr15g0689861 [Helianthus annuus]